MKPMGFTVLFFLFLLVPGFALSELSMEQYLTEQSLLNLGEDVYKRRCSGCHSLEGNAKTASSFLVPKPRDFTSGVFKFRSTPNGSLPTDSDMIRTITQGVIGTSMPAFKFLSDAEKLGLVEYIKTFSPEWTQVKEPPKAMNFAPPPAEMLTKRSVFLEHAKRGRDVFQTSCALCHGPKGRGDGPAAATLVDQWGDPLPPVDLTRPYIKSGYGAEDIYRALATGLNGTPMAAFTEALGTEASWDVVAFVLYLRAEKKGLYATGTIEPIEMPKVESKTVEEDEDW